MSGAWSCHCLSQWNKVWAQLSLTKMRNCKFHFDFSYNVRPWQWDMVMENSMMVWMCNITQKLISTKTTFNVSITKKLILGGGLKPHVSKVWISYWKMQQYQQTYICFSCAVVIDRVGQASCFARLRTSKRRSDAAHADARPETVLSEWSNVSH